MNDTIQEYTQLIKEKALSIGFSACGMCKAEYAGDESESRYREWIANGFHASLDYLDRNQEKRFDPTLLVGNAKSIVSVALNYYPERKQPEDVPQFAYYAYGRDYHEVVKEKLSVLFDFIKTLFPDVSGRCFTDSAPVMESHWATRAGIGFKGRNTLLIIPGKGSFFFLGELILDIELAYDKPQEKSLCGRCRKCIDACPTGALKENRCLDAGKCISYQTIENKSDKIDENIVPNLTNRVYGCDICQKVCPWNKYATPHSTPDFVPSKEFLELTAEKMEAMSEEDFQRIFKHSAVKRAKHKGLIRNIQALID
jgi:epoxyqueuosine reductase